MDNELPTSRKQHATKSSLALQHAMGMGKLPPQAIELEEAVLGSLMIETRNDGPFNIAKGTLKPESFYKEAHQKIYRAILELPEKQSPIDLLLVTQQLRNKGELDIVGGPYYVTQLINRVVSGENIQHHCWIIQEKFILRELIRISSEITKTAYEDTSDVLILLEETFKQLEDLKNAQNRRARFINLKMEPAKMVDTLHFNGKRILSVGNISALVAPPGTGKSTVCEAIACSAVLRDCDSFGFSTRFTPDDGGVLYIDTERSVEDVKKAMKNMGKRVMTDKNAHLVTADGQLTGMSYVSMIEIAGVSLRRLELEMLIKTGAYRLVILDGITDFIKDSNDIGEATEFISWLISIANTENVGIFVTIHDNPAAAQLKTKPRGHIGSELYRKCESLLLMKRAPEDKTIRLITSDFDYGKNRNDSDVGLNKWIQWSETWHQMRTLEGFEPSLKTKASIGLMDKFQEIFSETKRFTHADLVTRYKELYGGGDSTIKKYIKDATDMDIIIKDATSLLYMLGDKAPF